MKTISYKTSERERKRQMEYHKKNREKILEKMRGYYQKNKQRWRKYYQKNIKKIRGYCQKTALRRQQISTEWALANPIRIKEITKKWRDKNKEKLRIKRIKNWDMYNAWCRKYRKNPQIKIHNAMSNAIWAALKGKKSYRTWETLVGYTKEDLALHLEKQFDENMNWNNYGSYWQIDHIIPQKHFNFTSVHDEDFKKCWSLNNLQPLESIENRKKRDKILNIYCEVKKSKL